MLNRLCCCGGLSSIRGSAAVVPAFTAQKLRAHVSPALKRISKIGTERTSKTYRLKLQHGLAKVLAAEDAHQSLGRLVHPDRLRDLGLERAILDPFRHPFAVLLCPLVAHPR